MDGLWAELDGLPLYAPAFDVAAWHPLRVGDTVIDKDGLFGQSGQRLVVRGIAEATEPGEPVIQQVR